MKHILIICSLFATSLATPILLAQDEVSPQSSSLQQQDIQPARDLDSSIKMSVDFSSELDAEERIEEVTDLIAEFNAEVGQELKSELSSLSDEDKEKLVEELSKGFRFSPDVEQMPIGVVLIAVPAVVLIFGMPLFLLLALLGAGHRKRKQKMELVDLYIKNERDIPEHVVSALDNGGSASSLKSGLTLTAVGVGFVVALNVVGASVVAGFALIPMFLGIARLIFWFLVERKNESKTDEPA